MMPLEASMPAGRMTMPIEAAGLSMNCTRLPAELVRLADRLHGEFRRRDVEEDVGLGRGEVDDLRVDRGVGHLVAHLARP